MELAKNANKNDCFLIKKSFLYFIYCIISSFFLFLSPRIFLLVNQSNFTRISLITKFQINNTTDNFSVDFISQKL